MTAPRPVPRIPYRYAVLAASVTLVMVANGAMFILFVGMTPIAQELGWPLGIPSTAYSLQFIGGGIGGIVMGMWLDRSGMGRPALLGTVMIGAGAMLASTVSEPWHLFAIYGAMIGFFGNAAMFSPLMANITRWFTARRGMAVGLVTSGQSLAGIVFPPLFTWSFGEIGWRGTFLAYGAVAMVVMLPLSLVLWRRPPLPAPVAGGRPASDDVENRIRGLSPNLIMALLCCAIVGCCIAMSLPLVHIVNHALQNGITPIVAAQLLSVMLAASFVSRAVVVGPLMDRIGALKTLFLFSGLQAVMLIALAAADGVAGLFVVAAVFGFGYGGIGPCYPVIVREYMPARNAGRNISIIILFGTIGMAIGGSLGGIGFDLTGSFTAAFLVGVAFNFANLGIIGWLIALARTPPLRAVAAE